MFITPGLSGGGAEKVTSILASYYADHLKDEVTLLVCRESDGEYAVSDSVKRVYLQRIGHTAVNHVKRNLLIRDEVRRVAPDLIISLASYYTFLLGTGAFDAAPVVLSQRFDPKRFDQSLKRLPSKLITKHCYNRAAGVVFQTDEMAHYFSKKVIDKSQVILNPVKQLYQGEPPRRRKAVVTFCRICGQKNLPLLIDSFSSFFETHPDYSLEIYGEGPDKNHLKDWCATEHTGLPVKFLPFSKNVHQLVRDASFYVSSSDFEGLSNSMLEAMSLGLPVISTDSAGGGARLVIDDGVNGLLVPCRDRNALSGAMCKLADNEFLRKEISLGGVEYVKKLTPQHVCDQWRAFTEEISR